MLFQEYKSWPEHGLEAKSGTPLALFRRRQSGRSGFPKEHDVSAEFCLQGMRSWPALMFLTLSVTGHVSNVMDTISPRPKGTLPRKREPPFPDACGSRWQALELHGLLPRWQTLVRKSGREKAPNHLDWVLEKLGPMPPAREQPNAFAFWAAALLNPCPALYVAREIRSDIQEEQTTLGRLELVLAAFNESIAALANVQT